MFEYAAKKFCWFHAAYDMHLIRRRVAAAETRTSNATSNATYGSFYDQSAKIASTGVTSGGISQRAAVDSCPHPSASGSSTAAGGYAYGGSRYLVKPHDDVCAYDAFAHVGAGEPEIPIDERDQSMYAVGNMIEAYFEPSKKFRMATIINKRTQADVTSAKVSFEIH